MNKETEEEIIRWNACKKAGKPTPLLSKKAYEELYNEKKSDFIDNEEIEED